MFMSAYASGVGVTSRNPESKPLSFYELGCDCASAANLVEAHKWFNLAARDGEERAAMARADVALDMDPQEIAEAQRRARTFLLN